MVLQYHQNVAVVAVAFFAEQSDWWNRLFGPNSGIRNKAAGVTSKIFLSGADLIADMPLTVSLWRRFTTIRPEW